MSKWKATIIFTGLIEDGEVDACPLLIIHLLHKDEFKNKFD
jgi:hypothetical protein